jgi:hypothetical protein
MPFSTSRWSLLADPLALLDFAAAVPALIDAERSRRRDEGPGEAVPRFRARGRSRRRRDPERLARLERVVAIADRLLPGGPNCYRRVLAEISLDAGAAAEPMYLGIVHGQATLGGHAWLGDRREPGARYDVELAL